MTSDPAARVRAVCDEAITARWHQSIDVIHGFMVGLGIPLHGGDAGAVYQLACDVSAALDAQDAEIERLRAELARWRDSAVALTRTLTPADIGMVPVPSSPESAADIYIWLGRVGNLANRGRLWREGDRTASNPSLPNDTAAQADP